MVMVVGPHRGAQAPKGKGGAHKPREGGGSRRDRAAAEARRERHQQAEQAEPKNSIADAMPEELKQQAAKPSDDGPKPDAVAYTVRSVINLPAPLPVLGYKVLCIRLILVSSGSQRTKRRSGHNAENENS